MKGFSSEWRRKRKEATTKGGERILRDLEYACIVCCRMLVMLGAAKFSPSPAACGLKGVVGFRVAMEKVLADTIALGGLYWILRILQGYAQ